MPFRGDCFQCGGVRRGSRPLLRCSQCRAAFYCGIQCQRMHYPTHRSVCVRFPDVPAEQLSYCAYCYLPATLMCASAASATIAPRIAGPRWACTVFGRFIPSNRALPRSIPHSPSGGIYRGSGHAAGRWSVTWVPGWRVLWSLLVARRCCLLVLLPAPRGGVGLPGPRAEHKAPSAIVAGGWGPVGGLQRRGGCPGTLLLSIAPRVPYHRGALSFHCDVSGLPPVPGCGGCGLGLGRLSWGLPVVVQTLQGCSAPLLSVGRPGLRASEYP